MHSPTEQLLADLGIPVECCPTCEICNWRFAGRVDVGITHVSCQTCGRDYEVMARHREVEYYARKLADMMRAPNLAGSSVWYQRLVNAWLSFHQFYADERRAVCVDEGSVTEDDDETPF